jgi:hypothetical protein
MPDGGEPAAAGSIPFDVAGARSAGYSDGEIASYVGGLANFNTDAALKAGYLPNEIIDHLAVQPASPDTTPPSSTLGGIGKAIALQPTDIAGGLVKAGGEMVTGAGTALQAAAQNSDAVLRGQLGLMDRIDGGQHIQPPTAGGVASPAAADFEFGQAYAASDADTRAKIRARIEGEVAVQPQDTGLGQAGQAVKNVGGSVSGAGQAVTDYGNAAFPMTDEEKQRLSVKAVNLAGGLLTYIGAGVAGGPAAVIGLAGVQGYGAGYDEAKQAGATDEDAATAGLFRGLVDGGLMTVPIHQAIELAASIPGAARGQFLTTLADMAKSGATLTAFSQLQAVADNVIAKATYKPDQDIGEGVGKDLGLQFVAGALLPGAAAVLGGAGRLAGRAMPGRPNVQPRPAVADVLNAPDVDTAIDTARQAVSAPAEGAPIDVNAEAGNLATGDSADLQQAALLKLFDNTGAGTVEQAPDGGYHFRTTDASGTEITHPIEVWTPSAEPPAPGAEPAISTETADALRAHYGQAGVDVVFYKDDGAIPFDGAMDPSQPNTIFLSSDPARNVAQVAGHEFTHVLQTTTLPDGTDLGQLLNQQIAAGITPAGTRYAQATFGSTAPARAGFGAGPEGDTAHAAAVQAHLINELGSDIGGEAPKFQSFLPRVVDAIQQRFGNSVAGDVLGNLIDGLKSAMETVRGIFGDSGTRSQNWVTNIGEIHDTLAQMYAARFGTPVEREQAALGQMRDRAERDRVVADQVVNPVIPTAGSPEAQDATRAVVLKLRRWLDQLAAERDAKAAATPQAKLLTQTEAAIVRPVAGDETKLPAPTKARLDDVRQKLDAVTHPAADTPEMAKVRNELGATAEALSDQTQVESTKADQVVNLGRPPTEHPGLILTSLETGKTTHIQPPGTVPPDSPGWWNAMPNDQRAALVAKAGVDPRAAGWTWEKMARDTRTALRQAGTNATPVVAPDGRTEIGKNHIGQTLYEDQRGVRSYVENGVRATEPVGIRPGSREITVDRTNRPEYQVAEWHPTFEGREPEYRLPVEAGAPASDSLVPAPPSNPAPIPEAPDARTADRDHALAEGIASRLEQPVAEGVSPLSSRELQALAENTYGGTLASGAFTRDRLYDALELGVNRFIQRHPERFNPAVDAPQAEAAARELAALKDNLPTQTVRAGEKDAYQQFSTPPDYAFAANWVANLRPDDHVLEPSAGVGGLIVHAMNAGVRETTVNELSDKRRGMIAALHPTRVAGEDAAQLHNILPADVRPTVVVMNPPFSRAAERMGGRMVLDEGAKHIEAALARLEPGGRLVAIVGDGMKPEGTPAVGTGRQGTGKAFRDWWAKIGAEYDVRANIGVDRDIYTKYGTSFPTRLLVIDKNPPSGRPLVTGQAHDAADVIDRLQGVRDERSTVEPVADQPGGPEVAAGGEGVAGPGSELHRPTGGVGAGEGGGGDIAAGVSEPAGTREPGVRGERPAGVGTEPGDAGYGVVPVQSEPGQGRAGGEPHVATGGPGGDAGGGRNDSGGDGVRPDGSGERDDPGLTPAPEAVLATENAISAPDNQAVSEAVYEAYKPQRVQIAGARPHPGELVQSAAMATVMPPVTGYKPRIPIALVKSGALSDAQLEAIVYAGHAHSDVMADGRRRGFLIGDGTGVGKGREIAGTVLDNFKNGRTKAVWVSEKRALVNDARRDWNGMGQPATDIIDHGKLKPGDTIKADKGILFTSYDTLKSEEKTAPTGGFKVGSRVTWHTDANDPTKTDTGTIQSGPTKEKYPAWAIEKADGTTETIGDAHLWKENGDPTRRGSLTPGAAGQTRVDQIIKWVGKDFDGVIAFDEAHNMGNSVDTKGTRGVKKAAQKALAGMRLQDELPNARVVYVSATGATEVSNLAYMTRLGLWGEGTAFANRDDFIGQVSSGGIAGMELVARDMKALGHYIARNLSYDGVDYDRVEHVLSADQRDTYDKLAEGWQLVLRNFNAALEATGITEDGKTKNPRAKAAVMSAFWGGHQRFFNQIITSMQMPSVIRGVEADLKAGRQAVLQLVNTMEAAQERALEKARASGDGDIEDLDMTPRDQLMQLVEKAYPVQQMEEYVDDNGNLRSRPATDSNGEAVINKAAVAGRERLLDQIGSLRVPDGPLEMLLNHFGSDKVAEVTGRKQRVVRQVDESGQLKTMVEQRGAGANVADASSFQAGKKPILVFSEAGGTGRSYHAENGSGSQDARRSHYLVQGGWRADKAVQGFGRTHRTNQASAPIFHLVTTDLQGQKRFISSIARRLAQLGALTKGERRAADQGMFGMRDNLESTEARDGLIQFFKDVTMGQVEGVSIDDLEKSMGLKMRDDNGALVSPLPEMSQFLNRVLSLKVDHQNGVFQAFSDRMDLAIARASAAGTLDTGVETYKADKITKLSEQTVYTDPRSGAETKHVHLNAQNRNEPVGFAETLAGRNKTNGMKPDTFIQNVQSGRVFAVTSAGNYTDADGRIIPQARLTSPTDYQFLDREKVDRDNWRRLTPADAKPLWDNQVAATPEFRNSSLHIITGAVLPIWDRLGGNPKIFRLQTDQGERMLGRVVPASRVDATLKSLGAEGVKVTGSPGEIATQVLNGATARLANDWTIKRSLVAGEPRIELVGPDYRYGDELARSGVFSERIASRTRFFVPTEPTAAATAIEAIIKTRPVTSLEGGVQFSPRRQEDREEGSTPLFSALTRAVEGIKQEKATPGQWLATIRNMAGVKPEERAWTGLDDWLGKQPKSVTKGEVLDYLRANRLDMRDVVRGAPIEAPDVAAKRDRFQELNDRDESARRFGGERRGLTPVEDDEMGRLLNELSRQPNPYLSEYTKTKFGQYTLPGGQNYREMLMTLPATADERIGARLQALQAAEHDAMEDGNTAEADRIHQEALRIADGRTVMTGEQTAYRSSHWDEPNVVAHTRFAERTAPDGAKVLHIEEIQSDWHQAGRRQGYDTPSGVPDAPFKTTWPMLAMKRMTQYAVDHGFDRVAWTPGDAQADRYDLSKQIDRIGYTKRDDGKYNIVASKGRNSLINEDGISIGRVADLVGKEIAQKIENGENIYTRYKGDATGELTGLDLKVGGEGMRGFYDKQLPSEVQKLVSKFGAKVGQSEITNPAVQNASGWESTENAKPETRQSVHSFDITPQLREAVQTQGLPLFSPRQQVAVRDERETERWTPDQVAAYRNVGRVVVTPTWRERLAAATNDLGRRTVRAWLDPYIGVKADDPAGYMALRNANTTAGATEMFLTDGTLRFNGSTYAMDERNGGVEHSLVRPLHGEQDRFIWWVAANRAERLTAEDRENLWSQDDIDTIKATNQGQVPFDYHLPDGSITRSREAVYLDSLRKLDGFNKNVLDLAVQSGLLDGDRVSTLFSNPFYVPFYRVAEADGHFAGPSVTSGFVKQNAFKTLKGGTERLNNDLWDNAIKNWSHMIDASLRNRASAGVLDTGVTNGAVRELSARDIAYQSKAEKRATVWVMNTGQKQFFEVHDPLLFTAISALDFSGFRNPVMDSATKFKTILTQGVTADPRFMLRVSIRDAEQAIATAPLSYNVAKNVISGYGMGDLPGALKNVARAIAGQQLHRLNLGNEAADAIAGGGTMRLGSGHDTGGRRTDLDTMLDRPDTINAFWHRVSQIARAYKEVSAQSEDVQRFALYHKLIADGVPHDQAAFAARDLEDFTLKGAGAIARVLTQTVPFMNAWAQGLYKVGRAAANQDRNIAVAVGARVAASATKRVAIVLGATSLLTLALDAIYANDEDYKKRTEYDRDANFWFKFGNTQFRIPMGFEIAAMSRIAANGVEAIFGRNEMTPRRFANSVLQILGTNMSLSPVPQIVRPVLDLLENESGTGAPIIGKGMDRLRSEERYTPSTTLFARAASSAGNAAARAIGGPQAQFLAPIQLDYLVNGYFGWLGSHVVNLADLTVRGADQAQAAFRGVAPVEPVRPNTDLWNQATGGMISTSTTPQSRYIDMLYQQAEGISRTYATYLDLIARGRVDDARAFSAANKDQIAKHELVDKVTEVEQMANRQIKRVGESPTLGAEQKRLEIMKYNAMRNKAAENVFGTRPQ